MMRLRTAIAVCVLIFNSSAAFAQDPIPTPRDTTRQPRDTTAPPPVVQDSVRPIPVLADHYFPRALGFSDGTWMWDQSSFLLEATTTLSDFLERLPTVLPIRTGLLIQPEAASAFGGTAHRLEVYLDGYQLDPLIESSIDLAKIELVNVDNIRIERRLGLIRVHIQTIAPADTRSYSRVEAGVGEPESNLFRGILLVPKLFVGPFGVAIDRMDTDGFGRSEPGDQFAGWVKWSYIRGKSGLQLQYRRVSTDRDLDVPWHSEHTRDDIIAQLRFNLGNAGVAELFGGRSAFEADTADTADSIPKLTIEHVQWGGRLSFHTPFLWGRSSIRIRDNGLLPRMQIDAAAGLSISKVLAVSAEVTQADWRDAGNTTWYSVQAQLSPFSALRLFGELTAGQRGAPNIYVPLEDRPFINEQKGYRAGAEINVRGFSLGAAVLRTESDSSAVFGLPFDTTTTGIRTFAANSVDGWELNASVPLFLRGLTGYGMVTNWLSGQLGLYLPSRQYRAGLQLHTTPLRSGNLELFGRIEAVHRGDMFVPTGLLPEDNTIDAYAHIRIIDVRIFGRFEDITGKNAQEVAGRVLPGPRLFYGVKWQFWN